MTNVSKHKFASIIIKCPPDHIVSRYHEQAAPMLNLIASLSLANQRLAASRDFLLPRLMSGQLSVAPAERESEAA